MRRIDWSVLILVLGMILFAVLKLFFLFPRFSDGHIYLYTAYLITKGLLPYRDFFYSSPPLLPYVLSVWGLVAGFTWQSFTVLPILLTLVDAGILYLLARKWFSPLTASITALLYLFSFAVLATTDFMSDVHLVLTLILLAVLFTEWHRPLMAGVLVGIAILAKLCAVVMLAPLVLFYVLVRRWHKASLVVLGCGLVLLATSLLFWLWLGLPYFSQTILSHLGHIEGLSRWSIFLFFIQHDWLLVVGLLPAVYWYVFVGRRPPKFFLVTIICLLLFYFLYPDSYYLYWKLLIPWLALFIGWNIEIARRSFSPHRATVLSFIFLIAVGGWSVWQYLTQQAHAAVITPLNDIVHAVQLATPSHQPIYGAFELTPLVARLADRPIFDNDVDTNPKFFETNYFNLSARVAAVTAARVPVIVTKAFIDPSGAIISGPNEVLPTNFYAQYCKPANVFPMSNDYSDNVVIVWTCKYE